MRILPEELRPLLREPFGRVVKGTALSLEYKKAEKPLVVVGDQCFLDALDDGFPPDIAIFDFKIKRVEIGIEMKKRFAPHASTAYVVRSPPGVISDELEEAVTRVLAEGKGAVFVAGEDDLSSLLVMAESKVGTLIYGQPDEGAVVVELGEKKVVERAKDLLARMEPG
ncbi:MAG: DUF359 domain-containing protein [Candidatus Micrarchaeota archaeon]|nr:DUF359 domain-containing protein [Candidatus Micrarchaeota archaeon]